ncbi:hypothetical protein [Kitasatospora sp. NPDC017646]|uniref:hypothetical protein n=1 Tax=Kitasatospora sp. NPDC017646 TaxID=3364024 RepID=UPI0037B39EC0
MTAVIPDLPPVPAGPERRCRTGIRVAAVPAGHTLVGAVRAAHATRTVHRADLARRAAERQWPAMCHRGVYRALLARS